MHASECFSSFRSKISIFPSPISPPTNCKLAVGFFLSSRNQHQEENLHHIAFFALSFDDSFISHFNSNTHSAAISNKKKVSLLCVCECISHFSSWHWLPEEFSLWKDARKKCEQCAHTQKKEERRRPNIKLQLLCRRYFHFAFRVVIFFFSALCFCVLSLAFAWLNENF